jgi:hypothetical protein
MQRDAALGMPCGLKRAEYGGSDADADIESHRNGRSRLADDALNPAVQAFQAAAFKEPRTGRIDLYARTDALKGGRDLFGGDRGGTGVGNDQLKLRAARERFSDAKARFQPVTLRLRGAQPDDVGVSRLRAERDRCISGALRDSKSDMER